MDNALTGNKPSRTQDFIKIVAAGGFILLVCSPRLVNSFSCGGRLVWQGEGGEKANLLPDLFQGLAGGFWTGEGVTGPSGYLGKARPGLFCAFIIR